MRSLSPPPCTPHVKRSMVLVCQYEKDKRNESGGYHKWYCQRCVGSTWGWQCDMTAGDSTFLSGWARAHYVRKSKTNNPQRRSAEE